MQYHGLSQLKLLVSKVTKLGDRLHLNREASLKELNDEILPVLAPQPAAQGMSGSNENAFEAPAR